MTVANFDDLDDAIQASNRTTYGLAAGVWTHDIVKALTYAAFVGAAIVWANCFGVDDPVMPWDGVKRSGWGRENGYEVVAEYTETKSVCVQVAG